MNEGKRQPKMISVHPLHEHQELCTQVSQLMCETWPEYYGPTTGHPADHDVEKRLNVTGLPRAYIALSGKGELLGTATLSSNSHGAVHAEEPWITALAVFRQHRRHGVDGKLIATLQSTAKHEGFNQIFCTTLSASPIFQRLGWTHLHRTSDNWDIWTRSI